MVVTVVVDTSVLIAALLRAGDGPSRKVLRLCLEGRLQPILGEKLLLEFESVMARGPLFDACPLSADERDEIFSGFAAVCHWVTVHYLWRPNLPDKGDNHVLELAVAGGAGYIITHNVRHFKRGDLLFPGVRVLTPTEFLNTFS